MAKLSDLQFDKRNARKHPQRNMGAIMQSLQEVGAARSIVIDEDNIILAGNGVIEAAGQVGIENVRIIEADGNEIIAVKRKGLTQEQKTRLALFDNRAGELAEWDTDEIRTLLDEGFNFDGLFFENELDALLAELHTDVESGLLEDADPDAIPESAETRCKPGDLWQLGRHRLLCGDSRNFSDVEKLIGKEKINVAVTSPPYASQRTYDETSGFMPIDPDEYKDWFYEVQANISAFLADDGSFFLNIKEHCDSGQRHLYVKDLTIAHVREWGWLFVDEFCWRDTKNGVPGGWNNRFKDAWEPVFHYAKNHSIKFNPYSVGTESDAVFEYSPNTAKTKTGSGLLGEKATAEKKGIARPSNVIECASASTGDHSAAYPVALPDFFIKAFSDKGDVIYDPFMGSGTTLMAAELNDRKALGIEISAKHCDVILTRWEKATGKTAELVNGTTD